MRKSILNQLYDGELYPSETIKCKGSEYAELKRKAIAEKEYFRKTLSPGDLSRFEKLEDIQFEMSSVYAYEHFVYAFRLGVNLMIENFVEKAKRY